MKKYLALLLTLAVFLGALGIHGNAVSAAGGNLLAGLSYTYTIYSFNAVFTDDNPTLLTDGAYRGNGTVNFNRNEAVKGTTVELAGTYAENKVEFAFDEATSIGTIVIRSARAFFENQGVNRHCTVSAVQVTTDGLNYTDVAFTATYVGIEGAPLYQIEEGGEEFDQYFDIVITVDGATDVMGLEITLTTLRPDETYAYIVQIDEIEAYAPGVDVPLRGDNVTSEDIFDPSEDGTVSDVIESTHPYQNYMNREWVINRPGASSIVLTFNSSTYVENGYDYIYIYNGDGSLYGQYTNNQLASKRIVIDGNSAKIKLATDSSGTGYGFAATVTAEYNTYALTVTENYDGTVTVRAALPEGIDSGRIVVAVSDKLTLMEGSAKCYATGGLVNPNYNRDGVVGVAASFAGLNANEKDTVAFEATYRVAEGAVITTDDITVPLWDMASDNVMIGDQTTCDVVKTFVHAFADTWSSDGRNHWHECVACGEIKDMENHRYDCDRDVECNVCSDVREVEGLNGDVNSDNKVNNIDAALVLKYDCGLIDFSIHDLPFADVNDDESCDNLDSLLILMYDVGFIDML